MRLGAASPILSKMGDWDPYSFYEKELRGGKDLSTQEVA
jgi:hypothetical protein